MYPYEPDQYAPSYASTHPGFEGALPRPGGPVDLGLAGYQPPQEQMHQTMQRLRLQFPTPIQRRVDPTQRRIQAVNAAHMQAIERMKQYQHQRRYSGRRP